jgi:hypothetical protein
MIQKLPPFIWRRLEIADNIFDQNDRRIDDDPKIDGAYRQKIGGLA